MNAYDIQQMRKEMTTKEIAEYYNVKLQKLYAFCYRNNVILTRITDWEIQEGIQIYSVKELAYMYNISKNAIYARIRKMNLKLPPTYDMELITIVRSRGKNYKETAAILGYDYRCMLAWLKNNGVQI